MSLSFQVCTLWTWKLSVLSEVTVRRWHSQCVALPLPDFQPCLKPPGRVYGKTEAEPDDLDVDGPSTLIGCDSYRCLSKLKWSLSVVSTSCPGLGSNYCPFQFLSLQLPWAYFLTQKSGHIHLALAWHVASQQSRLKSRLLGNSGMRTGCPRVPLNWRWRLCLAKMQGPEPPPVTLVFFRKEGGRTWTFWK